MLIVHLPAPHESTSPCRSCLCLAFLRLWSVSGRGPALPRLGQSKVILLRLQAIIIVAITINACICLATASTRPVLLVVVFSLPFLPFSSNRLLLSARKIQPHIYQRAFESESRHRPQDEGQGKSLVQRCLACDTHLPYATGVSTPSVPLYLFHTGPSAPSNRVSLAGCCLLCPA
ncbi:hypothetical protein F4823DRAFT_8268 [Ustulina deusta]|nr:hypothetical protein F4823DRAFT_8268 [Ustulina deusta]